MNRHISKLTPFTRIAYFGLLILVGLCSNAKAGVVGDSWQFSFPVSMSGGAYFKKNSGQSTTIDGIYSFGELRLSSKFRSYSLGVFFDHFSSSIDSANGARSMGAVHRFKANSWDFANYVFGHKPTRGRRYWAFANRVRYRIVDNHKIGLETIASFRSASEPKIMLGYYGDLSKSTSVKLSVGTALNATAPKFAQVEFSWDVH